MTWLFLVLLAKPYYTGYAGSPVSSGSCAATCHGSGTFTVHVTGFPSTYTPGETYEITVSTTGGTIKNFNACVLDESNHPQGTLQPGSYTATYSHPGEGTGVHGTSYDRTSYTFFWTAPAQPVGTVKLYVAAHQGGHSGPNRSVVLTSTPLAIEEPSSGNEPKPWRFQVQPTVSHGAIWLQLSGKGQEIRLSLVSPTGRRLKSQFYRSFPQEGLQLLWTLPPSSPTGVYRILLETPNFHRTRAFLYLK